ncbi:hypothetical protein PTSG_00102 [Salpingoeca rosetta]|uniref:Uncharacterized protein n=1 Tax=Salpingoeca rosetta (strain ATCC 50818 / BSB-021) TaxID=946362 RepID=F2TVJ0_SALR5|nr:uncharacterized protein PTSG_00102 [Salpingoeca rosetta]EGD72086.1 hypothetical protein PTSG_00102 [Salpingoeca rosetta]|eukprot:XP_004998658.1 hypothetical protein PTSG_00102 [Salpingoeca rosetta]
MMLAALTRRVGGVSARSSMVPVAAGRGVVGPAVVAAARALHVSGAAWRKPTPFVIERKRWQEAVSSLRKEVMQQHGEKTKAHHEQQSTQAASKEAKAQQRRALREAAREEKRKKTQLFLDGIASVRKELKLIKIRQGQERYAMDQAKKREHAKRMIQKKMEERVAYITETDAAELERAVLDRIHEPVKYDFFVDTPKPNTARRISSVLSGFDTVFQRT